MTDAPKRDRGKREVVTPEDLWHESGLSRKEWNDRLIKEIKKLEKEGKTEKAATVALLLIKSDGVSVGTALAEIAARDDKDANADE